MKIRVQEKNEDQDMRHILLPKQMPAPDNNAVGLELHFDHAEDKITWKVNGKEITTSAIPSPAPLYIFYQPTDPNCMVEFLPYPPPVPSSGSNQEDEGDKKKA